MGYNQLLSYLTYTFQIFSPLNDLCLEGSVESRTLTLSDCDEESKSQKWLWGEATNDFMLNDWNNHGRPFEDY